MIVPRAGCLDSRGDRAGIIPFTLVGALANELLVERTRDDYWAFAALPAALAFFEFAGTKLMDGRLCTRGGGGDTG